MVHDTVRGLMEEVLGRDAKALGPSFALTMSNGVEPIDIAKLAMECEQTFHIVLHDEAVAEWRTLGDVSAHIAQLLEEGQAEPIARDDDDRRNWFYE